MNWVSVVGLAAAFCTTAAYVPQVVRTLRTRSTEDISLGMYLVMSLGCIFWVIYGVWIGSLPVILANGTALILTSIIVVMKLRER